MSACATSVGAREIKGLRGRINDLFIDDVSWACKTRLFNPGGFHRLPGWGLGFQGEKRSLAARFGTGDLAGDLA